MASAAAVADGAKDERYDEDDEQQCHKVHNLPPFGHLRSRGE